MLVILFCLAWPMPRRRSVEVFRGADDIPGDLAELYGYVNRSLPDSDLDSFVECLASRIASFDKRPISETKRFADLAVCRRTTKSHRSGMCALPRPCGQLRNRGSRS